MTQENSPKSFFGGIYGNPTMIHAISPPSEPKYAVPEGDGIYEDTQNKVIFTPVAGYTKPVICHAKFSTFPKPVADCLQHWNNTNRQAVIKCMMAGLGIDLQSDSPPVLTSLAKVELHPEPWNPYDKDAILVIGKYKAENTNVLRFPIGYIPAKITKQMIRKGWYEEDHIGLIFRLDDNGKNVIPQLVVAYEVPGTEQNRFAKINYE